MDARITKRKAHRVENAARGKRRRNSSLVPKGKAVVRKQVAADALPWKTSDVPEMFGDAEGFLGLEEATGVQVVKTGDKIEFHAAAADADTTAEIADDENDFEGFGDGASECPEPSHQSMSKGQKPKAKIKPKKKEKKNRKKKKKKKEENNEKQDEQQRKMESAAGTVFRDSFSTLKDFPVDEGEERDVSEWQPLNISREIMSAVSSLSFAAPTAIQKAAIPEILAGHDVIGKAATGSGKTLAFSIPILERWLQEQQRDHETNGVAKAEEEENRKVPIALVLSPTRELAHQLVNHMKALCSSLSPAPCICPVTGGLSIHKQQRQLKTADIVVGTPGRLWEVVSTSSSLLDAFKRIKFLVVDEADRLLSDGHFKEASQILEGLDRVTTTIDQYKDSSGNQDDDAMSVDGEAGDGNTQLHPRQTMVFSATFSKFLQQKLAGKGRYDLMSREESMEYLLKKLNFRSDEPRFIDINPVAQMAEGLQEGLVECSAMERDLFLYALLLCHPTSRTLVFTNSISSVRRLMPMLQNLQINALLLHSQMPQKARLRSIERFAAASQLKPGVLIATDVAARGLDIKDIDLVIHYHVPRTADAYVHRSGRTARASKPGRSILLCSPEDVVATRRLVTKVHAKNAPPGSQGIKNKYYMHTLNIERRILTQVKQRLTLAKSLADASLAKEKGAKEDRWLKRAADELGLECDSDELEMAGRWSGRGSGRKKKEDAARATSKAQAARMRAELKELLGKRINTGVNERYLSGGGSEAVDVGAIATGEDDGLWLGRLEELGFD